MRGQSGRRDTVLAGQVLHAHQPRFDLLQHRGIQVEVVADAREQAKRLVELDRGRIQHRLHLVQAWLVARFAQQPGTHLLQLRGKRLLAAELLQRMLAGCDQRRRVRMPAMAGIQLRQCPRVQRFRLQLIQLVLQPRLALADIAAPEQGVARIAQAAPAQCGFAHRGQQLRMPRKAVQQAGLGRAREQGLLLVLAVDLHQQARQFRQLGQARAAAIDPGARTTIRAQGASQLAGAAVVQFRFAQPGQRRRAIGKGEVRLQLGAPGAVAHRAGIRAGAAQEAKRVHQQRLAGTGFAGHHGQARAEFQLGMGDHGEIADGQAAQHRRALCLLRAPLR